MTLATLERSATEPARCDVVLDLDRRTLDVVSYGLWDGALTDRFLVAMEDVIDRFARSGIAPASLLTMIDLRQHAIQAQETVARVQPEVERYRRLSKRTAVVLSRSTLGKMQAERLLRIAGHRFFTSETLARKWLATGLDEA